VDLVTGNTYTTTLPPGYEAVDSMVELYELKPRKQKYVKENLQLIDSPIVVYSDFSDRYYIRSLREQKEDYIRAFVRKGIVYIPEERKCISGEISKRETMLLIEYYENSRDTIGVETKLKLLRQQLKKMK